MKIVNKKSINQIIITYKKLKIENEFLHTDNTDETD
jgi:hypothetical protein